MTKVLIADDEPLARRTLRDHLSHVEWIEQIDEVGDGLSAIRAVDELRPELLFLDIRMPGASGIAVAEQIAHRPYIIFTTAFDRYAVTAFEIGALDYLLKPFGRDRVRAVVERGRAALEHGLPPVVARAREAPAPGRPLTRVFVRERGRMVAVPLDGVERLEACDDYVALHAGGRQHRGQRHGVIPELVGNPFVGVRPRLAPVRKLAGQLVELVVAMQRGRARHACLPGIRFMS